MNAVTARAPSAVDLLPEPYGLPPIGLRARFYALMMLDRYLWKGKHSASPRFAAKERVVEQMQAASPFQTPCDPEPMPEVDAEDLDRATFLELTRGLRRPLVVRGFARRGKAVRTWTPEHLEARLGDKPCVVAAYDDASLRRPWDDGLTLGELPFTEYLRRMKDERLYISNSTQLVGLCPGLEDDLELERIRGSFLEPGTWDELAATNVFISSAKVYTSIHHAMGGNFFCQIAGRKRWTMLDPAYTPLIHPVNGRPFQYCSSAYGGWRASEYQGSTDNILFKLPRHEVVLEPGDLLYNAPWWWHEVENLDDFVVGCAVRHTPRPGRASPTIPNHPLFGMSSLYPPMRAISFAHYLRHRLTGDDTPLRRWFSEVQMKALYASLSRKD